MIIIIIILCIFSLFFHNITEHYIPEKREMLHLLKKHRVVTSVEMEQFLSMNPKILEQMYFYHSN